MGLCADLGQAQPKAGALDLSVRAHGVLMCGKQHSLLHNSEVRTISLLEPKNGHLTEAFYCKQIIYSHHLYVMLYFL